MRLTSPSRFSVTTILALLTLSIFAQGQFTPTGNLATSRMFHTATLLNSGKVLLVGGETGGFQGPALSSTELYDPASATFSSAGGMNAARMFSTATLLNNGKVLIACGFSDIGYPLHWTTDSMTDLNQKLKEKD
jgi:hypothetical protein